MSLVEGRSRVGCHYLEYPRYGLGGCTYFIYKPANLSKQEKQTMRERKINPLPVLQHCFLPLILDGRFMLWRLARYLPFALFVGFLIKRRPGLLPYFAVVHALMDISTWQFT